MVLSCAKLAKIKLNRVLVSFLISILANDNNLAVLNVILG